MRIRLNKPAVLFEELNNGACRLSNHVLPTRCYLACPAASRLVASIKGWVTNHPYLVTPLRETSSSVSSRFASRREHQGVGHEPSLKVWVTNHPYLVTPLRPVARHQGVAMISTYVIRITDEQVVLLMCC